MKKGNMTEVTSENKNPLFPLLCCRGKVPYKFARAVHS